MDDEVKISGKPLTSKDLEDALNASINNFGAPNQMLIDVVSVQAYMNLMSSKNILHPVHSRIKNMLHGKLKVGTLNWNDANVIEKAAEAFSNMGVFKHAPRD